MPPVTSVSRHPCSEAPPSPVGTQHHGRKIAIGYRPDIQILRAVAVVVVILFHLSVGGFSTGFLGVDVFFVISGYLMQSLYADGVGALEFYRRRARRLLPAYFAAVLATVAACFFVTLPSEFAGAVKQSLWASAVASNIGYWSEFSYFVKHEFRPMLHLWSLGVEAQFYLILPLLLRVRTRWIAAVTAFSFGCCLAAVLVSPKLSFYMMPFRVWEFGLGILAARAGFSGRHRLLGLLAMAGIAGSMVIPVETEARNVLLGHPALPALVVTALTALTLMCRLPEQLEQSRLGIAAQRIGDVSYSLYLVHFPVVILLNYEPFEGTRTGFSPWAIPIIAVTTLLFYFGLERNGPRLFSIRNCLAAIAAIWLAAAGLPRLQLLRFNEFQQTIFAGLRDREYDLRCGKSFRVVHPGERFCQIGIGRPVLLVGDSHADALKRGFARAAERFGWGTYLSVDNAPLRSDALTAQQLREEADARSAKWIFIHFAWSNITPQLIESARRELGNRMVLIEPTPDFPDSVPKLLFQNRKLTPRARKAAIDQYLKNHPDLQVIHVSQAFCNPECHLDDAQHHPYYFDSGHLTLTGAAHLEPLFEAWFRKHPAAEDVKTTASAGSPAPSERPARSATTTPL